MKTVNVETREVYPVHRLYFGSGDFADSISIPDELWERYATITDQFWDIQELIKSYMEKREAEIEQLEAHPFISSENVRRYIL